MYSEVAIECAKASEPVERKVCLVARENDGVRYVFFMACEIR